MASLSALSECNDGEIKLTRGHSGVTGDFKNWGLEYTFKINDNCKQKSMLTDEITLLENCKKYKRSDMYLPTLERLCK